MRVKTILSMMAGAALALTTATAHAVPVIDFSTGMSGFGGSVVVSADGIVGTDILIGAVTVYGAPVSGVWQVDGTASGMSDASAGALSFNTMTGDLTITGRIDGLGVEQQELLTGHITSYSWDGKNLKFEAGGTDIKSAELLAALGLPTDLKFQYFGWSLQVKEKDAAAGLYKAMSTDIRNTAVPEPASMLLMGSGLLGLAGLGRKRKK